MRGLFVAGIVFVSSVFPEVAAQACAYGSAQLYKGNWYCSAVKAITYTNFPGTGSYNKVTYMNASNGQCTQERYAYSGSLAPLNEELSLHIRGPTWLKQLAVYNPAANHPKRSNKAGFRERRHGHEHLHQRERATRKTKERELARRSVGEVVSAMIDGVWVSWTNTYGDQAAAPATSLPEPAASVAFASVSGPIALVAPAVSTSVAEPSSLATYMIVGEPMAAAPEGMSVTPVPSVRSTKTQIPQSSSAASAVDANSSASEDGSWSRQAYYNAAAGISEGFTFLNHYGGVNGIPGTAAGGTEFGASLSYASSDGRSGASSAQILSDALIADDVEFIIMSDKSCDDGGCGYTRPGGVAYHGFGGDHKIFLMEFSMPFTGLSGFNGDMPAIWLHNAQIPLTSQYGSNPDCSCWSSGCGEFDLFEILDSGDFRCKSTLHMAPAGGSSDYFQRPTHGTITVAVVFTGSNEVAHIQILEDGQGFDAVFTAKQVDGLISLKGNSGSSSLFVLSP